MEPEAEVLLEGEWAPANVRICSNGCICGPVTSFLVGTTVSWSEAHSCAEVTLIQKSSCGPWPPFV